MGIRAPESTRVGGSRWGFYGSRRVFAGLLWFVCPSRASVESFACCFPAAIVTRSSDFAGTFELQINLMMSSEHGPMTVRDLCVIALTICVHR